MMAVPPTVDTERQAFRQLVQARVAQGQMDEALALCDEALLRARKLGTQDFVDQVVTSRASLLVHRGDGNLVVSELRRLLLRSDDLANRFSAAYAISYHYDLATKPDKSRFYARQALRYAEQWGNTDALVKAHNVLANLLVLDSLFEDAEQQYLNALALQEPIDSADRAILHANLGYCRVVIGSLRLGYADLTVSLRMMRRLSAEGWFHIPMMGLSYACLEVGRPERARHYAQSALSLCEQAENPETVKKCLYLLGEAEKLCGHTTAAYDHFAALQRRFYPENPMIVDFLMAADVRRMINLMA